ncbi:hypothetical protein D915_008196 [Fasciola hepatica]|uniref:Telomere length regulation protein conserved domain-containing protein n=1 Tax=Fasciola hepatica TaxID=6192 RepID=A0A4E0R0X0_FASHE|nr:hypothetical protein D915_008196 [Fasciola hepatica]
MTSLKQFVEETCSRISRGTPSLDIISNLVDYPLNPEALEFHISDSETVHFYQHHLPVLIGLLIKGYVVDDVVPMSLIERVIAKGKSDVVFTCLFNQLVSGTVREQHKYNLLADTFEAFIFQYRRIPPVFQIASTHGPALSENKTVLEDFLRSLISLPSRLSNVCCGPLALKIFDRFAFVDVVLSSFTRSSCFTELCGVAIGQFVLSGNALEVAKFILSSVRNHSESLSSEERNFYGTALRFIKPDCIEPLISNMLKESPHPEYIKMILKDVFQGPFDPVSNYFLKVFRRIIFVRYFQSDRLLRNLFGTLSGIVREFSDSSSYLIKKVNSDLGYPIARLWADAVSIQRTSVEQRLYISQAFASWFTDFYMPLVGASPSGTNNPDLLSDVLFGISNHLANARPEIRTMGMVFGECILEILPFGVNSNGDCHLKFDYEETALTRAIKSSFVPLPSLVYEEDMSFPLTPPRAPQPDESAPKVNVGSASEVIDSDDDVDDAATTDDLLPQLQSFTKCGVASAALDTRKPRYLRECLDGMLLGKPEDNHTRLICFSVAGSLIREHPGAAKELVAELTSALLHSQPVISDEASFNESQHSALVALGVVAPKDYSRCLINEFIQPTCSFGLRQRILTALTDVACELSNVPIMPLANRISHTALDGGSQSSTQRDNRPIPNNGQRQKHSINSFIPVAGDFFFPLLNSVPQLHSASQKGYFAHQDASILTQLIATLGIICACAHSSPAQWRMMHEFLELLPMVYRHSEPTVRQASLVALGTVITTIPSAILFSESSLDSHELPNLMEWLARCLTRETDNECKVLASVTLSALMDKAGEVMPCSNSNAIGN